jgi:HEAT repeat protein
MRTRTAICTLAASSLLLGACETTSMGLKPGAKSIFEAFAPPSPAEAAAWAIDPYDADKRFRGTQMLANAAFAGEPVYLKLFTDNASDTDPGVRMAALRGLGSHGTPEHVPLIVEKLKDPDVGVRTEAARALQRLHNPAAIDALLAAIDPKNELEPQVRLEAASALGQYPENRVVAALIASLEDENLAVNRNTHLALRTLTGQDFGFDRAAWQRWYDSSPNLFAARSVYVYPVFSRKRKFYEYIPFVPPPPNEPASTPAGMTPGIQ